MKTEMKKNSLTILGMLVIAGMLYGFLGFGGSSVKTYKFRLISTDTAETISLPANASNVTITVCDSAMTGDDTLFLFKKSLHSLSSAPLYSQVAVHDLAQVTTATNVASMIPGNGVTKSYILPATINFAGNDIYIVRSNESTNDLYLNKTEVEVCWNE